MEKQFIGLYENHKATETQQKITVAEFLDGVKNGRWRKETEHVRAEALKSKEAGELAKSKSPCVTLSGLCLPSRLDSNLKIHSGLIAIDIDQKDNGVIPFDELAADKYCYSLFKSVRGAGAVFVVKINESKHKESFDGLLVYLANTYNIIADNNCSNPSRLRYVSFDADLVLNEKAATFKEYIKQDKKAYSFERQTIIYAKNDIESIVQQIENRHINLAENYNDWLRIGFAFAKEMGENGRSFFHAISSQSTKYDHNQCDIKYNALLRQSAQSTVNINTFFYYAKQHGLELRSARTIVIENFAKSRRAMIGQNGGFETKKQAKDSTTNYLKKMEQIEGEDVPEIIDKVMSLSDADYKKSIIVKGRPQESMRSIIRTYYDVKYNEITGDYEVNGKMATDRIYNSIWVRIKDFFENAEEKNAPTKDNTIALIESDFTPEYNPFKDFINTHKELKPKGNIAALLDCFKIDSDANLIPIFHTLIEKWLLGIISSMHGEHSVNLLVLCGKQGKGKTEFFRNLLPKELQNYYAESTLDAGKDDEILMTKKLLILDDEYGGKSKQDEKRLKKYTSAQDFTMRQAYARKHETRVKYAVLCGATNEKEVLNDYTGNRRIIPVPLDFINLDKYKAIDKTELFIELYHKHQENTTFYRLDENDVQKLNDITFLHQRQSEEEELLTEFFEQPTPQNGDYMQAGMIKNHIELNTKNAKLNLKALGAALYKLGFAKLKKRIDGIPKQVYFVAKKPIVNGSLIVSNIEEEAPF
jgi:hypothetical protein